LKWELDSDRVPFSVLLHESTHAFFGEKKELLEKTVAATPGLTMTLLGEGFAYAMAPGLYGDGEGDQLLGNVAQDRARDQAWNDPTYGRQREYALALRPIFRDARHGARSGVPPARDVFLRCGKSNPRGRGRRPAKLAVIGPASGVVRERLLDSRFHVDPVRRPRRALCDVLPKLGAESAGAARRARRRAKRVPAEQASLCPFRSTAREQLAKGETIAGRQSRRGARRAARDTDGEGLQELARSTPLLSSSSARGAPVRPAARAPARRGAPAGTTSSRGSFDGIEGDGQLRSRARSVLRR
jgi:hypothetical protein